MALSDVPGRVPDDERRAKLLMLVVRAKPEIAATDEARQAAGRIASPVWRASVYEALADASLRLHRGELVDDCILQAKAAVARMNEPYEQATALFMIARVEGRAGKHEAAKATITLAQAKAGLVHGQLWKDTLDVFLAMALVATGDWKRAMAMAEEKAANTDVAAEVARLDRRWPAWTGTKMDQNAGHSGAAHDGVSCCGAGCSEGSERVASGIAAVGAHDELAISHPQHSPVAWLP